ncbi:MAG: peptidylprolyl isomerase [Candidatus Scalindua sp.]|nr:peptidylprolyl isomerase [Candidatus Scalindua sp.]
MKNWLKEPLLHFLIAGGMLFALYGWINRASVDKPRVVRISAKEMAWLKEMWSRQWHRPPDEQVLRGLVTDYLKERLLAAEAKELGLEENDTIVRRRLAQKMEFLIQDTARLAEPGENELRNLYNANRAQYQTPERITFTQLYFRTEAAAQQGLYEIKANSSAEQGEPSLLEHELSLVDEQTVSRILGESFAQEIFSTEDNQWHGPVESEYGFHLVQINERVSAQMRPFEDVHPQLLEEWQRLQQARIKREFFAGLLKKYEVVMDESVKSLIGPLPKTVQ